MILFDDGRAIAEDCISEIGVTHVNMIIITKQGQHHFVDVSDAAEAIFARDWLIAILDEHQQAEPMAIIGRLSDILERTLDKLDDAEDIIGALASDGVQIGHA